MATIKLSFNNWSSFTGAFLFIYAWIGGVVLEPPVWYMKALGVFFFPHALYLFVQKTMVLLGVIP